MLATRSSLRVFQPNRAGGCRCRRARSHPIARRVRNRLNRQPHRRTSFDSGAKRRAERVAHRLRCDQQPGGRTGPQVEQHVLGLAAAAAAAATTSVSAHAVILSCRQLEGGVSAAFDPDQQPGSLTSPQFPISPLGSAQSVGPHEGPCS